MSEEKSAETGRDISTLLTLTKEKLTLNSEEDFSSLDEVSFESLLQGKYIPYLGERKEYVCPLMIHDLLNGVIYPLIFIKTDFEEDQLRLVSVVPIVNELAEEKLEAIGFKAPNPTKGNFFQFYELFVSELERSKTIDKIRILPGLFFVDKEYLSYNLIYAFLGKVNAGRVRQEKKADKEEYGDRIFPMEEQIFKAFKEYRVIKVEYLQENIRDHFIEQLVDRSVKSEKNLLIIASESEKDRLIRFFEEEKISPFVFEHTESIISLFSKEKIDLNLEEVKEDRYEDFEKALDDYDRELERVLPNLLCPEILVRDILSSEIGEPICTLNLDVKDYTAENYERDREYLIALEENGGENNFSPLTHPFCGLTASSKKTNYEEIQLLVLKALSTIGELRSILEKHSVLKALNWYPDTIEKFDEIDKNVSLLKGYNGFPKKYFSFENTKQRKEDLSRLKKMYQSVSSSRLLMNSLFYETIYVADLNDLIDAYQKSGLSRWKAKFEVKKHLKNKTKTDYETLFRIVKIYCEAQKTLKEELPKYREIYGDNVMTMNDVVEVESNIKYIESFHERTEECPRFSLEDSFVKKWMSNKNFRADMTALFQVLEERFETLKGVLRELQGYFLDTDYHFESVEADSLIERLKIWNLQSYATFEKYATLREKIEQGSPVLYKAVQEYLDRGTSFKDFSVDFRYSLIKGLHDHGLKKSNEFIDDYHTSMNRLYSYMIDTISIKRDHRYNVLREIVKNRCESEEFVEEYRKIRDQINSDQIDRETMDGAYLCLSARYPITIALNEDVALLSLNAYDTILVTSSAELSDAQWVDAQQGADEVIFLHDSSRIDQRNQKFPEYLLNEKNVTAPLFQLHELIDTLNAYVKKEVLKRGYEIDENSSLYPLLIRGKRNPEYFYALVPMFTFRDRSMLDAYRSLRMFLSKHKTFCLTFSLYWFISQLGEFDEVEQVVSDNI